ncbi:MAG: transcriptional repressor [bacterium]|nr:transcriptional repressor [bacterium]
MERLQIESLLKEKGIKPSVHRMKILEYLLERRNHPTVDMIFQDISGDIPTLSKTTIYNTLKTFLENNVVQAITIEENEVRFDATLNYHAHFKCVQCGTVYDVDLDNKVFEMKAIKGHKILECHMNFKGICKDCLKN